MNDWRPAPNIGRFPDIYERENEAIDRDGRLQRALFDAAPWSGRRVLDVGTGTGFWLTRYTDAASVIGVEPDPALLTRAQERVARLAQVDAIAGSAEHLPLEESSVDLVHARWAHFFGPGCERGLEEVERVLAPGGTFVVVDNSWAPSDFTELLRDAVGGNASMDPERASRWWADRDARRIEIMGGWKARSAEELEQILRIEFPTETVDRFVARHEGAALTYAIGMYVLHFP